MAESLVNGQHDGGALAGIQLLEGGVNFFRGLAQRFGVGADFGFHAVLLVETPAAANAFAPVQAGVDAQALEPGREFGLGLQGADLAPGLEKDFLGEVIGILGGISHPIGH
jgi:hypothetical protein